MRSLKARVFTAHISFLPLMAFYSTVYREYAIRFVGISRQSHVEQASPMSGEKEKERKQRERERGNFCYHARSINPRSKRPSWPLIVGGVHEATTSSSDRGSILRRPPRLCFAGVDAFDPEAHQTSPLARL